MFRKHLILSELYDNIIAERGEEYGQQFFRAHFAHALYRALESDAKLHT